MHTGYLERGKDRVRITLILFAMRGKLLEDLRANFSVLPPKYLARPKYRARSRLVASCSAGVLHVLVAEENLRAN
jgi:hypothetical protein